MGMARPRSRRAGPGTSRPRPVARRSSPSPPAAATPSNKHPRPTRAGNSWCGPARCGRVGRSCSPTSRASESLLASATAAAAASGATAVASFFRGGLDSPAGEGRPRRQRLPLSDLNNLSPATSVFTRLLNPNAKPPPRTSPGSSTSSIGSSTVPRIPTPPPPPPPPATLSVAATKGKDKATRELQISTTHLNKIQKISKHKVKTRCVLPGLSSPPSKNTRKMTRKEQPHTETEPLISPLHASSKTRVKTGGDVLTGISSPPPNKKKGREEQPRTVPLISPFYASSKTRFKTGDRLPGVSSSPSSKKTRKVTSSSMEEQLQMEEMSCDESLVPSKDFIVERRAYFAEIDALELVEEFVSSSESDAE